MDPADVDLCVRAGVHAVGFVVDYPVPVPWNLTPSKARDLINKVPPFVNSVVVTGGPPEKIVELANTIRPDIVQLHYKETLADVKEIACRLDRMGIKAIKALRVNNEGKCDFEIANPVAAAKALSETKIAAILVDSYTAVRPGGTGIQVDRGVFKEISEAVSLPLVLAGGLNPANICQIIAECKPYAVDVLTGVEETPGRKDPEKVNQFMKHAAQL